MLARIADDQFSVDTDSAPAAQSLADHLRASGDWIEVVPGIESVVVQYDASQIDSHDAENRLRSASEEYVFVPTAEGPIVKIPVHYGGGNGPDLAAVCADLGISEQQFIQRHTAVEYPVEMVGFTPGFAFVGGLQEQLRVPRRAEPRTSVPSGSVAIADSRTGLYAMSSPGGWNIVGRTELTMFDPAADEPFLLSPGMRVRFVAS